MNKVARTLSQSIKENKWVKIKYINEAKDITSYWIYIVDINPNKKSLDVYIFNDAKSLNTLRSYIYIDSILEADILDLTCGFKNDKLIKKIEDNPNNYSFLEYDAFSINTLYYLKKAYIHDIDPSLRSSVMIEGIELDILKKNKCFHLNETQVAEILSLISKIEKYKNNGNKYVNLCLSILSIDHKERQYVVLYYKVRFNPKYKCLFLDDEVEFNASFQVEGATSSIYDYLDISIIDFKSLVKEDLNKAKDYLMSRLGDYELLSTLPIFYLQEASISLRFNDLFSKIEDDYLNKKLSAPLKSFFGLMSASSYVRHTEPSICLVDKLINIDQMRVIYNALKYPVTFVQGPPGTGKTKTIINVIFSILLNNKTVLITSSNNKPVDSISESLTFTYLNKRYKLPFLRLGNYQDTIRALNKIKAIFKEISTNPLYFNKNIDSKKINNIKLVNDKNNKVLVSKLKLYERKNELIEIYKNIMKITTDIENKSSLAYKKLIDKANIIINEANDIVSIKNEEITSLYKAINESKELEEFFFKKRLSCLSLLNDKIYDELRFIVNLNEDDNRFKEFNKYISKDENLKNLLKVFPIILDTNISSSRLGENTPIFDLVIMDESGQCNITTAIFPISKGKNLLLVGDPNQLKPIVNLDTEVNAKYMIEFSVNESYNYDKYSILDSMRLNDVVSKYILLRYHYRCGKKIINFSNKRYYQNKLLTEFSKGDGELVFIDSKNNGNTIRNSSIEEARGIIEYIKRNKLKDAMIITPFVNQKNLIHELLIENNLIDGIGVGTIHSLQGSEKDTIIFSMAISPNSSRKTYDWLKNNSEVINVGVTRAKSKLIIACDHEAISAFSDHDDDLYYLINYVKRNGDTSFKIPPSPKVEYGKSNGSYFEDEFFKTISQFCSIYKTFKAKRNVPFSEIFSNDEVLKNSNQEFDCVLYENKFLKLNPVIAIEINGGEHFGNDKRESYDKKKMEVCKAKGIKLLIIPNTFVKSYEEIKQIIFQISKNNKDYKQLSLFD